MSMKPASLRPTNFCDCDNKKILDLAHDITAGCSDDREKVIKLFDHVKNNYRYAFGPWDLLASQTADLNKGMCTTKANLLVAILRATGIQANFKVIRIKAREVFGKFAVLNFLKRKISEVSIHIYVAVYFDCKWHDIDPSLDRPLIKGLVSAGYNKDMLVDWKGEGDYLNFIEPDQIVSFLGCFENIDNYHEKKRKTAKNLFLVVSNFVMDYYRFMGKLNFLNK